MDKAQQIFVPKPCLGIKRSKSMNDAPLADWDKSTAIERRESVIKELGSHIYFSPPAAGTSKKGIDQETILNTLKQIYDKLDKLSKEVREMRCTSRGNSSLKSMRKAYVKRFPTSIRTQRKRTEIPRRKNQRKRMDISREKGKMYRFSWKDFMNTFSQIIQISNLPDDSLSRRLFQEMTQFYTKSRKSKADDGIMDLKAVIKDLDPKTISETTHEKLHVKGANAGTLLDSFLYRNYHNGLSKGQTNLQFHPLIARNFEEYVEKELCSLQTSRQREVESLPSGTPHSMNLELIRFETFKNFPRSSSVSTIKLAKEGFYYCGDGDRVVCFACGSERSGWRDGDIPREIHHQISPQCYMLNAGSSDNIPIGGVPNGFSTNIQPASIGQSRSIPNAGRQNIVNSNTPSTVPVQSSSIHHNGSNQNVEQSENISNNGNAPETSTSNGDHAAVVSNDDVSNRLSGLNSNPESLPRSGACAQNTDAHTPEPNTNTVLNRSRNIQEKINAYLRSLDPLGISFDRPKYHAYAVLATRISSFKDWPTSMTQTPRDLATAGFLYAGYGDYTRCFFCGGGLRNWEAGDEPWTEHARWFPKCAFLRQNKGDEFVALVQIEHQEQEELEAGETGDMPSGSPQHENVSNGRSHLDIVTLSSFQSVLEMGYSTDVVKQAFNQLKATKDPYEITGQNLMEVILSNEDRNNGLDIPPPIHNSRPQSSVEGVHRNVNSHQSNGGTSQENQPSTSNEPQIPTQGASGKSVKSQNSTDDVVSGNEEKLDSLCGILPSMSLEDTASLIEENRKLKDLRLCKICLENDASIAMLPCGHLCCCADCAPAMRKCPICRQFVKGTVRTWLV
ncbi:baculoviral IAP repeat-containing protein 3-like isoform X2 [Ostrea edulis]|nr:baculoviral IAP repeat-containing protein 3-like isoform X2 [Ostrea edulis]XP_048769068.1 baculoviral IAP repeat-containing protein 3-like isoform X2 [Ostrea edulis]XP_056015124.1 baculoviral IAP repeat-containing protein 3-like isoform X2 [Ostrea edulis]XP_056015125.1 baculoviral IAP repeat-containing protein 3-like isoform X2 [Ostrea edulis]XP_056015126.1 baculoviral IAP repeat-containing protein 3-like isoform X2 [Ostrea edulis]XP_056015127.1 baculoviral IAP repeat-containing protein 3-l